MEAVIKLAGGVGHTFPIRRVMLPGAVGIRQALTTDFVEVLNVNIDIVITVAVIAAMIPVIVMMVVPVVVIIPVDVAEDGVGCRHTQAEA